MDIRGIEVTNQLRSAIRAKLLELGVRYDEELPDYILVMVVNKKTRQQMHEDLRLFLEGSTTIFVEWLHDQVLKKLQKVTVARKKTLREFVPAVVIKQEEERKKRIKNNAQSCLEDSSTTTMTTTTMTTTTTATTTTMENMKKITEITAKEEKTSSDITENTIVAASSIIEDKNQDSAPMAIENTPVPNEENLQKIIEPTPNLTESQKIISTDKIIDQRSRTIKRQSDTSREIFERPSKRQKSLERKNLQKTTIDTEEKCLSSSSSSSSETDATDKKLKSCVNKPNINSVISVKTRLGTLSQMKKFENKRLRLDASNVEKLKILGNERNNDAKKFHDITSRSRRIYQQNNDDRAVRANKIFDNFQKSRNMEKTSTNVKDRLGICKNFISNKATISNDRLTIKNRLGPFKSRSKSEEKILPDDDDDDEDDASFFTRGPVKSRVIAVNRGEILDKRCDGVAKEKIVGKNDGRKVLTEDEETQERKIIASKVIVTPRPLKPLQPLQKRATQSLLLRAVAEANRSVVRQKNPEPVMADNKPRLKRPRQSGNRDVGKNLSVHLNATKRLVMEKIQVQLSTEDNDEESSKSKQYNENPVNEEHMGVVMSLFQRSDDNQKFLVTLNGYNNNVIKDNNSNPVIDDEAAVDDDDDDEERLEMEVIEDVDMVMSKLSNDLSDNNVTSPTSSQIIENDNDDDDEDEENDDGNVENENEESTMEKIVTIDENNENENIENVDETIVKLPERKRRKLSPIVYARSRSSSPDEISTILPISLLTTRDIFDKRTTCDVTQQSNVSEKSRDKCRYWPNCTLGTKCSYYHPGVLCSAFPACKYGDSCIYKHPNCKFGLSCTKLGCAFTHPKQQCKYHPFCTKAACTYSHPAIVVTSGDTTRGKFTWKRRD